ncbi:MAG: beta-galactosidase [Massilibacteroides sp.]|nr:beta-galactosidase [Massilibacteroides sp.]MDD3062708.1 beta-galactosidase [Massilibacteroides sp.]MDD4116094.1 beta-galactosidase [Massilibacteroides sp.]MDD4660201.1 beta-galactosidase [Massilibacteroides sp.]
MRKIIGLFGLLSCSVAFSQSPVDCSFPKEDLFALGSYYYPEQWDASQWERDLKKMSEMGIQFTHFAEFAWGMLEPEEGVYHFDWLDRAVSLADKYGLKVILCTPSPTPPVWLSKKYPDVLIQRDNGIKIQHGRRQHASWSSDRYRQYVETIVSKLGERYGNHPAVIGWQIDNEPGHYGLVDYSPNAQMKFRIWLKKKYGTIEKLNETWGTSFWSETYQTFDQICLPNAQELPEKPNPHAMLDLNRFMADELASFVNMQADVLRRHIDKTQWVTTNLIPIFNPVDPVRIDQLDFLTYTRYLVTGHKSGIGDQGFRLGIPEDIGFSNDQFRNFVGKAYGVMELQPGQVNWGVYNPQPMPGAVRMWVYHVFAGGGKFVCNYRFRQPLKGSEQYHYGMVMTDGVTISPGGEEYVQIAQEMKKLRLAYDLTDRIPQSLSSRRVGMLFDMNSYWETEFQKQTDQWSMMSHIHKYYNLLKSFVAPVDVISEKDDFSAYPFLIAPAYQLLDSGLVERWTHYVKQGGHLILTCRTAQKDRDAKLWEAPLAAPIHALIGIDNLFYDHMPWNLFGNVVFNGQKYAWNNWADVLTPKNDTEVWATYADQFYQGAASVIHRKSGKGSVTYIGTDTDDGKLEAAVMRRVYAEAEVSIENLPYGVVKEWRDGFYIALNYTSDIQQIAIPETAEVLIGSAQLKPAGVVVWKEKESKRK